LHIPLTTASFLLFTNPLPPTPTLFPYTTLFRSLAFLGDNTFGIDAASGNTLWSHGTDGTIAASPLLTRDGHVVLGGFDGFVRARSEEHTSELQSLTNLVCRLLLEKKTQDTPPTN